MNLLVAGSRGYKDYEFVCSRLDYFLQNVEVELIVNGGEQTGVDFLAYKYAINRAIRCLTIPADWNNLSQPAIVKRRSDGTKYNALAGPRRNTEMLKKADALVAFWDGRSSGTKDMIQKAKSNGLKVKVVKI